MSCFHPLVAWKGPVGPSGKSSIVWKASDAAGGLSAFPVKLPCGQCIGCRLERSRQWAMRCVHESSLYKRNCFITLTYDDSHLPEGGSLLMKDFQNFMKRLRKEYGSGIRFFHCGEYGESCRVCRQSRRNCECAVFVPWLGRPHFHACLFNFDFDDKVLWTVRDTVRLYRSPSLERLWPFGFSSIGDVTFESAAYVARYITKKVNGELADDWYVDRFTGECLNPEYVTMSRGSVVLGTGGIGRGWFDKFKDDLYPSDYGIFKGRKIRPAKFYDSLYDIVDPAGMAAVKARRNTLAKSFASDNDLIRLPVKERVKIRRLKLLKRPLEAL